VQPRHRKKTLIRALQIIAKILKREFRVHSGKNILLIQGLNGDPGSLKELDCDDISAIYLVIAERLGLPLEPVYCPGHVFLQVSPNFGAKFFWEPTLAQVKNASYYEKWLGLPERSDFPRILGLREFEAILFCNLGVAWYRKGKFQRAGELFEQAVEMNPGYVEAYNNWGVTFAKEREWGQALRCYSRALLMDPRYPAALLNAGISCFQQDDYLGALDFFHKALIQDPDSRKASKYRSAAYRALQSHPKSGPLLARRKKPPDDRE